MITPHLLMLLMMMLPMLMLLREISKGPSLIRLIISVLAAAIGVQKRKNLEEDFEERKDNLNAHLSCLVILKTII